MNNKKNGFPTVGVDDQTSPDGLDEAPTDGGGWWSTKKTAVDGDTPGDQGAAKPKNTKSKKWRSTATEEMENFKHIPVVGRLPWRTQYMICSILLVISLLGLFTFAMGSSSSSEASSSVVVLRNSTGSLGQALLQVSRGENPSALTPTVVSSGDAAARQIGGSAQKMWSDLKPLADAIPKQVALSTSVVNSAKKIEASLSQSIIAAAPLWRQSGSQGEWNSVEAVNFAQVLSEIQFVQDVAARVSQGHGEIPERFATAKQNIEQSFRIYASSPSASQTTPLSQAWRALASGFVAVQKDIDVLAGNRAAWNAIQQAARSYDQRQAPLVNELAKMTQPSSSGKKTGLWISGTSVFVTLLFLIWISWKQQRWQILEAQSSHERLQMSVEEMGSQLRNVSSGDLTARVKPTDPFLRPLSDLLNKALINVHSLVLDVRTTAEETEQASAHASDTTGFLVENARAHAADLKDNGQDVISISEAMQNVSSLSQDAEKMARDTMSAIDVGQDAVEDVRSRIVNIREKTDDGFKRAHRLQKSSSEILNLSTLLNEVAEQISVLAVQATLQAAKAGEAGQGFRVVADGLKVLSERSGDEARRMGSLIEATVADVQAVLDAMKQVEGETDEGIRLGEVTQETSLMISQRVAQLQELVEQIHQLSSDQETKAAMLLERTQNGLRDIEDTSLRAQQAAEAVVVLSNASSALKRSAVKFKV